MEELVDSVWSVVGQGNECEYQWEGVEDSGKTGTDVRGRDMGIENGTGTKVGFVEMRMVLRMFGVMKLDNIRNERIKGNERGE